MQNRQIYILDRRGEPCPIGVTGEIHIAGAGVARGYLNDPILTRQRFLPNPFSTDADARFYKTGDLGRWRADGAIEYAGRNDQQVKIRGFRIELGDIEAQLLRHPLVQQAVVVARGDENAEKNLCAYVSADMPSTIQQQDGASAAADMIAQWQMVHEETYSTGAQGPSFVGWDSSYTGEPIPEGEMQEWLDCTIARIRALRPRKVLEIGCGVGLVLQHIAAGCETYVGTDFAPSAIAHLRHWLQQRPDLQHVQLLRRAATELQDLQAQSFDTVLLNSVVQYFPSIEYLLGVLRDAVRLLSPGGHIVIGDVRHLGLLPVFHSAVQLGKAAATVSVEQLRKRISRAIAQEEELVIDPQFFHSLQAHLPAVTSVDVQLKRGHASNELTRYRYDVVLATDQRLPVHAGGESIDWHAEVDCLEDVEEMLARRSAATFTVTGVPNARLAKDVAAHRLIHETTAQHDAGSLRRQLAEQTFDGVDPESLCELGEKYGYDVRLLADAHSSPRHFRIQFIDRERVSQRTEPTSTRPVAAAPLSSLANMPLEASFRQQLIPQLREYLKERLPDYMVPTFWTVMKQLPLTPSGKVDRRALPAPQSRGEEVGEYVPPRSELERSLVELWAQVLQVDQVGIKDNFFEIGGHSLLAMQVIVRIRSSLAIEVPMTMLFEFPTVQQLSEQIEALRHEQLVRDLEADDGRVLELLETVAAMPAGRIEAMMREIQARQTP